MRGNALFIMSGITVPIIRFRPKYLIFMTLL